MMDVQLGALGHALHMYAAQLQAHSKGTLAWVLLRYAMLVHAHAGK
jgi:hypothetical protein